MPLPLLSYQDDGARFLAGRYRAGLFDRPGVGKTAQAIRACDLRGLKRIIVICPAAVRRNWIGEFRKFATVQRTLVSGETIHDYAAWRAGRYDVLVASFDLA